MCLSRGCTGFSTTSKRSPILISSASKRSEAASRFNIAWLIRANTLLIATEPKPRRERRRFAACLKWVCRSELARMRHASPAITFRFPLLDDRGKDARRHWSLSREREAFAGGSSPPLHPGEHLDVAGRREARGNFTRTTR